MVELLCLLDDSEREMICLPQELRSWPPRQQSLPSEKRGVENFDGIHYRRVALPRPEISLEKFAAILDFRARPKRFSLRRPRPKEVAT